MNWGHRLYRFRSASLKQNNWTEHRCLFLAPICTPGRSSTVKSSRITLVEVEKKRKGLYDYESAWQWALSLSKEERAAQFKGVLLGHSWGTCWLLNTRYATPRACLD